MIHCTAAITDAPIDLASYIGVTKNNEAGAQVIFCGDVRRINEGKEVLYLEYECHASLAKKSIQEILQTATLKWSLLEAVCIHRTGRLQTNETAVLVITSSQHRAEAYEANRYIMRRVKHEAPIWKREFFADGSVEWSQGCLHDASHDDLQANDVKAGDSRPLKNDHKQRYLKQMILPDVGLSGQQKLQTATVAVIGCGALGNGVATSLVMAGVGKILLIDDDTVEALNLHRQFHFTPQDAGLPKAQVLQKKLAMQNPGVQIESFVQRLSIQNFENLLMGSMVIADCTDNLAARHAIARAAAFFNIPHIFGGIYRHDYSMAFFHGSPCFDCVYPPADNLEDFACDREGVLGTTPLFVSAWQANEILQFLISGHTAHFGKMVVGSMKSGDHKILRIQARADCSTCARTDVIKAKSKNLDLQQFKQISLAEIGTRADDFTLLNVGDNLRNDNLFADALHIPYLQLPQRFREIDAGSDIVLFCEYGIKSKSAIQFLTEQGYRALWLLKH